MTVVISLLRGVNLGGHHKIKMDALKTLYQSLKLRDPETYVQSGNVVFKTGERDLAALAKRIEGGIERKFGFHADVILRTAAELNDVIARNPFAKRRDIDPARFLVTFLAAEPSPEARAAVQKLTTAQEELRIVGREVYTYYATGLARPKLPWMKVAEMLKTTGTGRNWNTVTKLVEIAERLRAGG